LQRTFNAPERLEAINLSGPRRAGRNHRIIQRGTAMKTLGFLSVAGAALSLALVSSAASQPPAKAVQGGEHHGHMLACAKVCAECSLQCDSCHHHCVQLVANGAKDHAVSMELCVDCAEACRLASALAGRQSRLASAACECCAKCCDECGTACESFKDDKHMAECAKSCRDCAKACREMVQMLKK
jgi:hypothetical protein